MQPTAHNAPRPDIHTVMDVNANGEAHAFPRFQWFDRPGGPWIPDYAVGSIWSGLVVHWREHNTPTGLTLADAVTAGAVDARYHAFDRDWDEDMPGVQGSDGLQYHYYIADGIILQTRPETKHLWHAAKANSWSLAICIAAGPGDGLNTKNAVALYSMLNWFCFGRPDLPLITPLPVNTNVLTASGTMRPVATHGVLWHDEARSMEGLPPKGCCGPYKALVKAWRESAAAVGGPVK
jgi:hypothetical protein